MLFNIGAFLLFASKGFGRRAMPELNRVSSTSCRFWFYLITDLLKFFDIFMSIRHRYSDVCIALDFEVWKLVLQVVYIARHAVGEADCEGAIVHVICKAAPQILELASSSKDLGLYGLVVTTVGWVNTTTPLVRFTFALPCFVLMFSFFFRHIKRTRLIS